MAQALVYYHKSLEIQERVGDWPNAAITYFNLGSLYSKQRNRKQAHTHYEKAKALYEMVGDLQHALQAAQALRRL